MSVTALDPECFDWATGAGGADAVRRVARAAAEADGREPLNEAALLSLRHRGLRDAVLLVAGDGFAYLHDHEVELVVAPAARGRGLGRALAEAVLARAPDVAAWSHGNHPAAARLAARLGFRAVRELWLMRRPCAVPLPEAPAPDGFALRAFRPGYDEDAVLAVNATAFATHPEQGALDRAGLAQRMAEPWFDPAGLLVGERDGRVQGFHWTKVHPGGPGEVYVIGVHPDAQGTGLGRALLVAGLRHLCAQGVDEVVLYVEADNPAAARLYQGHGFTHATADTDVKYARP